MRVLNIVASSALLIVAASANAWGQQEHKTTALFVDGYSGQATAVQLNGRLYVDVESLARLTNSSLVFENGRTILALASTANSSASPATQDRRTGFSRSFMSAAIEAIASMREWGSTLLVAMQNGFPLGNSMNAYRARAVDGVRLAAAAVSTDSDRGGLELLTNELNKVQAWSNRLVDARNSMSAAELSMSENALKEDPMFQAALECGQFLGQMLAGGSFQDDPACH